MLLFIRARTSIVCVFGYSNTSHVIVYLKSETKPYKISIFKYISCYCLSRSEVLLHTTEQLFKYISCYCLSISSLIFPQFTWIQIHLMLLFIRLNRHLLSVLRYSNTSHVIVYRCRSEPGCSDSVIQIHLMLLFIGSKDTQHVRTSNSNTSHVIVYQLSEV